jgi:hypothetical protein
VDGGSAGGSEPSRLVQHVVPKDVVECEGDRLAVDPDVPSWTDEAPGQTSLLVPVRPRRGGPGIGVLDLEPLDRGGVQQPAVAVKRLHEDRLVAEIASSSSRVPL